MYPVRAKMSEEELPILRSRRSCIGQERPHVELSLAVPAEELVLQDQMLQGQREGGQNQLVRVAVPGPVPCCSPYDMSRGHREAMALPYTRRTAAHACGAQISTSGRAGYYDFHNHLLPAVRHD